MARPALEIDSDQVEKLASIGCRTEEIAHFFGCSRDTIERRFREELDRGRAGLKISIRKWQLESARAGNIPMRIFLGKVILKQREADEEASDEAVKEALKKAGQATAEQLEEFRKKLGHKK